MKIDKIDKSKIHFIYLLNSGNKIDVDYKGNA